MGFPPKPPELSDSEFRVWLLGIRRIIRALVKSNVLPVVAIGNEGPGRFRYPGVLPEVLGVGAVDFHGQLAEFSGSHHGELPELTGDLSSPVEVAKPDLVGYGVGVYSSLERDYSGRTIYQRFNGTSMATPYVAGIAALYRCRQPGSSVKQITRMLLENAAPLTAQPELVGAGLARFR